MTSSGTYAYAPALSDLIIQAFGRCQIRRSALTAEHLSDAKECANLLQVEWANRSGINLWTVDLVSQALTAGTATYNLEARTLGILAAYISTGTPGTDRIITSISRDDYAAFPDKTTTGVPTVYWFNRQVTPQITVWQSPDTAATYTLKFYRARQIQDAAITSGQNAEIPYRFLEAYTAALALALSRLYPPQDAQVRADLKEQAAQSWIEASTKDVEDVPLSFAPAVSSYYRGAA
jgi:hypothetical protein